MGFIVQAGELRMIFKVIKKKSFVIRRVYSTKSKHIELKFGHIQHIW